MPRYKANLGADMSAFADHIVFEAASDADAIQHVKDNWQEMLEKNTPTPCPENGYFDERLVSLALICEDGTAELEKMIVEGVPLNSNPLHITIEESDRRMRILHDIKKVIRYEKSSGKWYWEDRNPQEDGDPDHLFDTFAEALHDAVKPYLEPEE